LVELPCMVLANLTRSSEGCARLLQVDDPLQGLHVCRLLDRFISDERRSKPLSWIGLILTNITQVPRTPRATSHSTCLINMVTWVIRWTKAVLCCSILNGASCLRYCRKSHTTT